MKLETSREFLLKENLIETRCANKKMSYGAVVAVAFTDANKSSIDQLNDKEMSWWAITDTHIDIAFWWAAC